MRFRSLDGGVDVLLVGGRNIGELLHVGRIDRGEIFAGGRRNPSAADEEAARGEVERRRVHVSPVIGNDCGAEHGALCRIADLERVAAHVPLDIFADLLDDADNLMAENAGTWIWTAALVGMNIRAANRRHAHPHQDFAAPNRAEWKLFENKERIRRLVNGGRSHAWRRGCHIRDLVDAVQREIKDVVVVQRRHFCALAILRVERPRQQNGTFYRRARHGNAAGAPPIA